MQKDPEKRIDIKRVLEHKWFEKFSKVIVDKRTSGLNDVYSPSFRNYAEYKWRLRKLWRLEEYKCNAI